MTPALCATVWHQLATATRYFNEEIESPDPRSTCNSGGDQLQVEDSIVGGKTHGDANGREIASASSPAYCGDTCHEDVAFHMDRAQHNEDEITDERLKPEIQLEIRASFRCKFPPRLHHDHRIDCCAVVVPT
ncbi:uncharacterized protein EDB93DRAFT_1103917 [Suillus bovinus]|uniref:uncharacterized protein n=1 Tax=Suillus bovinus TaxID=48563 RepID=UPI001B87FBB2|nr:uncharacterized protein EDB93DRAFT_1103917 [Suillus bovinus]KAG2147832.1 hypothetical protein EDB93DRAFT_1103917 [Suillus bovinus]